MLVHRPALQAVEVLVQPLVPLGQEGCAALLALIRDGPALDYPPPHPRGSEHQVEGPLSPRDLDLVTVTRDLNDGLRLAMRAASPRDDDALTCPQLAVNALAAAAPHL